MEAQFVLTSKKLTVNESKRASALLLNLEALPTVEVGRASLCLKSTQTTDTPESTDKAGRERHTAPWGSVLRAIGEGSLTKIAREG